MLLKSKLSLETQSQTMILSLGSFSFVLIDTCICAIPHFLYHFRRVQNVHILLHFLGSHTQVASTVKIKFLYLQYI